jgi:hypothetical protein
MFYRSAARFLRPCGELKFFFMKWMFIRHAHTRSLQAGTGQSGDTRRIARPYSERASRIWHHVFLLITSRARRLHRLSWRRMQ